MPPNAKKTDSAFVWMALYGGGLVYALYLALSAAYTIRLRAILDYGPVIHEFDPYFNYRATEYLYWNGARRFFTWFDTTVWYPLGRPVGTTIYPGMQFIAVFLKKYILRPMSLNDICCYMPAWFGVLTTIITGAITYEATLPLHQNIYSFFVSSPPKLPTALVLHSPARECAIATAAMMAIVPAHLMRSMGGGYDNESVAVTAMVLTFYLWMRSLRPGNSYTTTVLTAVGTALAYFYMVAAWGGYVFCLNLIGVHAAVLVALGRFTPQVHAAYSIFYALGTALAVQVPVVGWVPLKSLEQLGPGAVFLAYQLLFLTEYIIRQRRTKTPPFTWMQAMILRLQVLAVALFALFVLAVMILPTGYFGPISSRVRGLFVQHTKTGNPLVDSVAEHQPASTRAYFDYLHHICALAPIGYILTGLWYLSDPSSFLIVWGAAAYYFSLKMVRLVLLTAPIACILGGVVAGRVFVWCVAQWAPKSGSEEEAEVVEDDKGKSKKSKKKPTKKTSVDMMDGLDKLRSAVTTFSNSTEGVFCKRAVSVLILIAGYIVLSNFVAYSWRLSLDLSHPTIIQRGRTRDGKIVTLDDYREAYWWIRDNTPKDSRIMAWWDYGYQISAIANRTTLADGNTWNHEHIALLGKALTSDITVGYEIARHLADYVLIWGGGGGDDLAKSPHLARIANSVYRDHCPNDPTCRAFGVIDRQGTPSAMMRRSLLFNLHSNVLRPEVNVSSDMFVEVFRSKYGKVRIYEIIGVSQESKKWVEENRVCDHPGSWFCPGQYPPALKPFIDAKKDFRQLEDFNRGEHDAEYQKRYFEDLNNPETARKRALEQQGNRDVKKESGRSESEIAQQEALKQQLYNRWEDSEAATLMWNLINDNNIDELKRWLDAEPHMAFLRSKDGRGPMFWAFEQRNEDITKLLMERGLPHTDKDSKGLTPADLLQGKQ